MGRALLRQGRYREAVVESRRGYDLLTAREAAPQGFITAARSDLATGYAALGDSVIGLSTQTVSQSREITILADKSVPFSVLKKVMSTCTLQGYERISLAVLKKETETSQTSQI